MYGTDEMGMMAMNVVKWKWRMEHNGIYIKWWGDKMIDSNGWRMVSIWNITMKQ